MTEYWKVQRYTHLSSNVCGENCIEIAPSAFIPRENPMDFDRDTSASSEYVAEEKESENVEENIILEEQDTFNPRQRVISDNIAHIDCEPSEEVETSEICCTRILDSHPGSAESDANESIIQENSNSENYSKVLDATSVDPSPNATPMDPAEFLEDSLNSNLQTEDIVGKEKENQVVTEKVIPVQSKIDSLETVDKENAPINSNGEKEEEPAEVIILGSSSIQDESAVNPDVEMTVEQLDQPIYWPYKMSDEFLKQDSLISIATTIKDEFKGRNLKGCKWAPDGSCLLSNSDDNIFRLYNLPQSVYQIEDWNNAKPVDEDTSWTPALSVREGGQIYDYAWFPLMNSSDSVSACFLSTACDGPVHLRDAFTGSLRASYLAYNQYDEVTTAYSVAFDPHGENIYCGFNQTVRIFNISRPGRQCTVRVLKHKVLPDLCQKGIISCITVNPTLNGVYACGSYRRTVGLYLEDGSVLCILEGHLGGVTHLSFSHDGSKLFTGGRKDSRLICWDMRNMGEEYQIFDRVVETNQRIYFEISRNDRYLISGGSDGCIRLWDLSSQNDKSINIKTSTDCVNGVSLNPFVPILATASGQRHFPDISEDGDSDDMFVNSAAKVKEAKEIKLWKFV